MRIDSRQAWREVLGDFLDRLDPGRLNEPPVYILDSNEIADAVDMNGCFGVNSPAAAANCEPVLRTLGLWRGWSPLVAIVDREKLTGDGILQVAAHELVHGIETQRILERIETAIGRDVTEEIMSKPTDHKIKPDPRPAFPWVSHGPLSFGRLAIHCFVRSQSLGLWASPQNFWNTAQYQLPPAEIFLEKLGSEPQQLRSISLLEISKTPPPAAYTEFAAEAIATAQAALTK